MGIFDRIKSRLGLSPDDDEYYEEDEFYEEPSEDAEAESRSRLYAGGSGEGSSVRRLDRGPDLDRAREATLRAVPPVDSGMPAARPAGAQGGQMNMYICEPKSYSEAQAIADRFKVGTPVIMNLSSTDAATAKRLFDFASGLTYGRDGSLQKVSDRVFMLTPPNVSVSAEDRRRLKDTGLFTFDG